MAFIGRKPTNAPLTSDDIPNGIIGAADLASGISGLITWQSVQTTGFTASAGRGYPCNTTSAGFTVTLPATPSAGDEVIIVDYAGTFATNNLIITSTTKINGSINDVKLTTNREATRLVYIDSTQGYIAYSGVNEGTSPSLTDNPPPYSVDFLVVAGGGAGGGDAGGGGGAGGYRNSFSTETSGGGGTSEAVLSFEVGVVYTVTIGAGGVGSSGVGTVGGNSSISGTGITTITSTGGGTGGDANGANGSSGGSGGGGGAYNSITTGGSGTANQGYAGGDNSIGTISATGGAGGGAGGVGGNAISDVDGFSTRGAGLASSITGSSVTRAEGGRGAGDATTGQAAGGANTGTGGDASGTSPETGQNGGSGVVILRANPAASSTTRSSFYPTSGEFHIYKFNSSGSITY
jgi:hypothetical protein